MRLLVSTFTVLVALACLPGCSPSEISKGDKLLILLGDPSAVTSFPSGIERTLNVDQQLASAWEGVADATMLEAADWFCGSTLGFDTGDEWLLDAGREFGVHPSLASENGYRFLVMSYAMQQVEYCATAEQNRMVVEATNALVGVGVGVSPQPEG
jgi:hypothetical protein